MILKKIYKRFLTKLSSTYVSSVKISFAFFIDYIGYFVFWYLRYECMKKPKNISKIVLFVCLISSELYILFLELSDSTNLCNLMHKCLTYWH